LGGDCFPYEAEDYSPLDEYDVLILHTAAALYDRVSHVLDLFPHKAKVLKLTCDAMFLDPQGFFPRWEVTLKSLLDRATLVLIETADIGFFQAMTKTPVATWPHPVPVAALRQHAVPRAQRRCPAMFYLGSAFRPKKNGLATALAFRTIRERIAPTATAIVFSPAQAAKEEAEAFARWGIEGVEVAESRGQDRLWPTVAQCELGLHLDFRRSIGRFSVECAGLGIPCISTPGIFMQRALFPEIIVDPWDVEGAASMAERLLRDPGFYDSVARRAAAELEHFDLEPMAARFWHLLRSAATPGCQRE
jgi:hypothetical protein